jgi:hypothetical protein
MKAKKGWSETRASPKTTPPPEALVKHFSEASWADFAKKLVSKAERMAMQKHLDDGCEKCTITLQTWESVVSVAEQEQVLTPPDDIVRVVKSFAAAAQASPGVQLVFDSNLQPAVAGIRGSVAARQLLYQTDQYFVDLRLEPRRESDRGCLVGQVMNRSGADWVSDGIAVRLKTGNLPLAETTANQFGEFQFDFEAASDLSISIVQKHDDEVVLPLSTTQVKPLNPQGLD